MDTCYIIYFYFLISFSDDEKFGRRDRYVGPTTDFKEKDNYKPNVKLDYIDDDGHILNAKEAFRYLSHKFHGKGPGKNKVEKRMKKNEQEGVSHFYYVYVAFFFNQINNYLFFFFLYIVNETNEFNGHTFKNFDDASAETKGDAVTVCCPKWK